jgi:hypothetical protein
MTMRRRIYTHNYLINAAKSLSERAQKDNELHDCIAGALFCALALEACLNYIGAEVFPIWESHLEGKLTPEGKLQLLTNRFEQRLDFGQRPFQAFRPLFQLRNQLAHGRVRDLAYQGAKHWVEYRGQRWPADQWEVLCGPEQVASVVSDAQEMISILHAMTGVETVPQFLLSVHLAD